MASVPIRVSGISPRAAAAGAAIAAANWESVRAMPPQCGAFLLGDAAHKIVDCAEGCRDDQNLLGRGSPFQPSARDRFDDDLLQR
jgi:hypothetical protein